MKSFQESLVERLQNMPVDPYSSDKIVLSKSAFVIICILYVITGTFLGHLGATMNAPISQKEYIFVPVGSETPNVLEYLDIAKQVNPELEWEFSIVDKPYVGGEEQYQAETVTGVQLEATSYVRGTNLASSTQLIGSKFVQKYSDYFVHQGYEIVDYFSGLPTTAGYLLKKDDLLVKVHKLTSLAPAEEGEVSDWFGNTPVEIVHTILITTDQTRGNEMREALRASSTSALE